MTVPRQPRALFYVQHLLGIGHLNRAATVCSVRDILVAPSIPMCGPEMVATIKQYYDKVLIYGDPDLVPFEKTFPLAGEIADWLAYTGYIVDPPPPGATTNGLGRNEVIVSAGGGALNEPLLTAAISARGKTRLKEATWRLLAGPSLADDGFQRLRSLAHGGVIVERARADFTALLANCALSISQGGYNTIMSVLAAMVRAVIAPYAGGKETEQTLRADLLRDRGAPQVAWEDELSPKRLARAVDAALDGPRPDTAGIKTDGASASAALLAGLVTARLYAVS